MYLEVFVYLFFFFTSVLMKLYFWEKSSIFFSSLAKVCLLYLTYHRVLQFTLEASLGRVLSTALYTCVCPCGGLGETETDRELIQNCLEKVLNIQTVITYDRSFLIENREFLP